MRFDERIENYLQNEIKELKALGIYPVTRPMALRSIIEKNRLIKMETKRKKRSRFGVIINLK